MTKTKIFIKIILTVLCISYLPLAVWADDAAIAAVVAAQLPMVKVAINDDQAIINDRILYEALMRSGHLMVAQVTGMRTALADVNYGDAAILPLQTDGLDIAYPNLIKVPVAIEHVEFTAYSRSNEPHTFSKWSDMAGLRLGYRLQNVYVANNAFRAGAKELKEVNTLPEVWAALLNGETDVVVLPRMAHYEHRFPRGVKRAGVIESQPCFTYVNNKYDYLVPLLENAYLEMIADGTMDLIKDSVDVSGGKQIILHLYSYSEQIEWERSQIEFIRKGLELDTALAYRSINLNSNELHSQASYYYIISDMIRTDFIARYPDLVIASGNEALEFVLNNYYLLFPQTPVIFFGVLGLDESTLYGLEDNVTGACETISFYATASQMLRLYPKTRRIFILNDHYISKSMAIRREIEESINAYGLPVEVVFSENKPLAEILNDIRGYGSDTLVMIGSYLSDTGGSFYSETDIQKLVSAASGNPVFCLSTSFIGHGTMGGLLSGTEAYTDIVSAMVSDILKGTPPASIPIIFNSASLNQWQFDYKTAKRFKIDTKTLPQGHIVINRTLSVWESNPQEFTLMLAVAGLLLLIICGLIVFSRMLKKKKAEAETASIAKSVFLSNMSHEIRTPMNAIIGMAELSLREETSPTIRDYALGIRQAGINLLGIINDILDFSKIESGKMDLVLGNYTLSSLINDVIHTIKARAHESRLRFIVNVDNNLPNTLEGDVKRIRQILLNLLSNAVKYTDKGFISLCVNGKMTDENSLILNIEVSDSGRGIKQQDLGKLFNKFTRLDNASNKNVEGTGLGLAITKSFVVAMNGEINVRSKHGIGSTFTVALPQKIKDRKKLAVVENSEKKNVLVYERREICQKSIIQTMDGLGVSNRLVSTTAEFFEELTSNKYSDIFVSTALYDRARDAYGELKTNSKIILIAEFGEVVDERNISVLTTPIFSLPVADFLNNVSNFSAGQRREHTKWIAPGARILSVDDINTNLNVFEGLLKPYKAHVVSCKSGMEALEAVKAEPFDLVFMDHMMPGMDGIETTKRIRAISGKYPNLEKMPIIALSANAVLGMKEKFLQDGLDDFLTKPIDMGKLHSILRKWIPEEKWEVAESGFLKESYNIDIEIKGANVSKGIAIAGGSIENYLRILDVFQKDCVEKVAKIYQCLATDDLHLYTTHVHALKSAAANIGAENLSLAAGELENAGKKGDISLVKSKNPQFLAEIDALLANIHTILTRENDHEQINSSDMALIKEELSRLKEAIETFDSSAAKKSADILQKYAHAAGIGAAIDEILGYVLIGDDDKAVSLIVTLIQG